MSDPLKYGLIFLGGMAVGTIGTVALSRNRTELRPLAANLLSRCMDAKDAVAEKAELIKEGVEDLAAEARQMADERRTSPTEEA